MTTAPLFLSSGNLLADRRFQFAADLASRGDDAGAAELLQQTVEIAPDFVSAWFALGEIRARLGERDGAVAALQQSLRLDPQDRHGASLHLVRLGAQIGCPMAPAYVRTLFDQYAPHFDRALVEGLGYRAPAELRAAIADVRAAENRTLRFAAVLDLGCGTGLAGEEFRPLAARLTGVDLSPGMIAVAAAKKIYDRLETGDLLQFLKREAAQRYELVIAADVFAYLPDLGPIAAAVRRVLAPQGLFAFTVETHPGSDVILGEKLRFAHSRAHVRAALADAGLVLAAMIDASTRTEAGVPVPGLVVIAASDLPSPLRGRVGEGGR
jgi:predicted TPR repeat methyltransferase